MSFSFAGLAPLDFVSDGEVPWEHHQTYQTHLGVWTDVGLVLLFELTVGVV